MTTADTHSGSAKVINLELIAHLELIDHADADVFEIGHLLKHASCLFDRDRLSDELLRFEPAAFDHAEHRRIAKRLDRERASELDFFEHDLIDRQRYFTLFTLRG